MKKITGILMAMFLLAQPIAAQTILSLDSCREMALRNNKHLNATKLKQEAALNARKAARTNYLPKVDALGSYQYFNREISILNETQKGALNSMGTTVATQLGENASSTLTNLVMNGVISAQTAHDLGGLLNQFGTSIAQTGDALGQAISDAFRTDTRNLWAGSVMLRQPLYMGGAISASNRMADIAEDMARTEYEGSIQSTLYQIDETYWLVVSLKQKMLLAHSFRDLIQHLDDDVHKLIDEGIATRADGLKVDVKVNEADMAVTMVEDGYTLAKMLLCQLCGLPIDSDITLADEESGSLDMGSDLTDLDDVNPKTNRSELKLLQNAIDMSKQGTKLIRAAYLPQVLLTGGYAISNPNLFNGFDKNFAGVWNVGLSVRVPVWNWGEGIYKVRASKAATNIAQMEMNDATEKIDLQISQCRFKVEEANKRLSTAIRNLANAEENLRCANVGFTEGIMESSDVMAAQTAWQAAQSQKIDAQIEVRLSHLNLRKALGVLR